MRAGPPTAEPLRTALTRDAAGVFCRAARFRKGPALAADKTQHGIAATPCKAGAGGSSFRAAARSLVKETS